MSIAIVVLAAGGSTRMGRPKQLLQYRGEALVRIAARAAIGAGLGPVIAVVGAASEEVQRAIEGLGVHIVMNHRWAEGMGTSIALGIGQAERDSSAEGALIMLADQPMVDEAILRRLVEQWRSTGSEATACTYGSTVGVPAVFSRTLFPRLQHLPPGGGAKQVLTGDGLKLSTIGFSGGLTDIDTPDDYNRLTTGDGARDA